MKTYERTWEVDYAGLGYAIDAYGLKLRVDIRLTGSAVHHRGRYRLRRTPGLGLHHSITVSSYEDRDDASRVLWHELTHALQAENDLGPEALADAADPDAKPTDAIKAGVRRRAARIDRESYLPWKERPSEIEAVAGETFADEIALAKTKGAVALKKWSAPSTEAALTMSEYRR